MDRDSKTGTDDTMRDAGPPSTSGPPALPPERYVPGVLLGRGGMGEVISARDAKIGRSVAIKRMRSADSSPEAVARFVREARIQGALEHPAIVPVHDVGEDENGQPYFIMKQLAGVALVDILDQLAAGEAAAVKKYPRQRLLRALADVCLAVEFAHRRGIVHRDLKPANIVLGEFGEVYVLDWGIARVLGERDRGSATLDGIDTLDTHQTSADALLGTPGYMSPEQIRGDADLDGRADVYSLGCILFEMLALAPLHPRGLAGLAVALAGMPLAAPSAVAPDREIPPELDAIVAMATRAVRDDRFATARELGEAVQGFLDGDRDLALRRDLARSELDGARAALARGNSADDRRVAIRAAARALALDPTQQASVDLVGRLMIEPPVEIPREVEDAVAALDLDAFDETRPVLAISGVIYFAFAPIMWWVGFRDLWLYGAGAASAAAIIVFSLVATRAHMFMWARLILVSWTALIVVFGLFSTPLLVAPGLATATAMASAGHPRMAPRWVLVVLLVGSVLVPWLLAGLDVLPTTVSVVGNTLVLHARATALDRTGTYVALVVYVIQMVVVTVLLQSRFAVGRRAAQRVVQLQAWQLRQLVPRAATAVET